MTTATTTGWLTNQMRLTYPINQLDAFNLLSVNGIALVCSQI